MITKAMKSTFLKALPVGQEVRLMNCLNPVWRLDENGNKFAIPVGEYRNAKVVSVNQDEITFDDGYGESCLTLPWRMKTYKLVTKDFLTKPVTCYREDMRLEQQGQLFIISDEKHNWEKIHVIPGV